MERAETDHAADDGSGARAAQEAIAEAAARCIDAGFSDEQSQRGLLAALKALRLRVIRRRTGA